MSAARGARSLRFAVPEQHRYRELQALEDAVNFRLARLMAPCPRGASGFSQCDDHGALTETPSPPRRPRPVPYRPQRSNRPRCCQKKQSARRSCI